MNSGFSTSKLQTKENDSNLSENSTQKPANENILDSENEEQIESDTKIKNSKEKSVKSKSQLSDTVGKFKLKGKRVECLICNKEYNKKDAFNHHFNRIHRSIKRPTTNMPLGGATCDKCNKNFTTKYYLKIHTKVVHDGNKYQCEICEKQYSNLNAKKVHIKNKHMT